MVMSRVLKKDGYFFKQWLFIYILFILFCNRIKQAEIVKNCGKY